MPGLNPKQFSGKFYHGTDRDLDELKPAAAHGQGSRWKGTSRPESAYVTTSEDDAWHWAGGAGRQRVYEVEPYGDFKPDRNLAGPQFEVGGARVVRELPGPPNSQLKLFPDVSGRSYVPFEEIAANEGHKTREQSVGERLSGGYQGAPQDTSLFDDDVEMRATSRGGKLPFSARTGFPESLHQAKDFEHEAAVYRGEKLRRADTESKQGLNLRKQLVDDTLQREGISSAISDAPIAPNPFGTPERKQEIQSWLDKKADEKGVDRVSLDEMLRGGT